MVPAMTFNPSDNIALANCLASISVGNDFVCLGAGARDDLGRHSLGLSNETYQLIGDNLIAGHDGRPLRPINATVAQPTPIHFFSKFIGVSLHVVACKPIATARLLIRFDLPPDVLVKCQ
jgi:hypothetical protein